MTDRIAAVVLLVAALALATDVGAGTYRWVDERGNVIYSDRPPQPDQERPPVPEARPESESRAPEMPAPPAKAREAKAFVPPAAVAKAGSTKVDNLLELSGARAQLVGLVSQVADELRPPPGQMSTSDRATVDRILGRALRPDAVYPLVRDAFYPHVDPARLEATAAWLRLPLARKITALEIASSEARMEQKVTAYAADLKLNPPRERRVELLRQLDWVTGAHEASSDLVAAIARGVSIAVSAAGPPEQRLRPGQIEDQATQVRAQASDALRDVRMTAMLYTYRSLDDDELVEYIRFSASDAGRWYNAAMHKALVSAIGRAVEQTSTELVRAVPLERWAPTAVPAPRK